MSFIKPKESSAISCNTEHTRDTCRHEVGRAKGRFELKRLKRGRGGVKISIGLEEKHHIMFFSWIVFGKNV